MGSSTVFSAWDGDRLVGLVRVLDDTEMVAYMHYVLVDPEYQGHGIAGHLVGMVKERYRDYLYIEVMPEESKNATFYQKHASQSWKTARPCRSAIRENAAETSIVTPTILLPPSNDGGIAFSSIRQYIGGLACMLHPKGSQHDRKRRTEHAERDECWEGCVSSAFRHEVSSPQ